MIKYSWIWLMVFSFGLLYLFYDLEKSRTHDIAVKDFENFLLIEYNKQDSTFNIITDLLDKTDCIEGILDNECLQQPPIMTKRVESIKIRLHAKG